jgi:hypothetical protein
MFVIGDRSTVYFLHVVLQSHATSRTYLTIKYRSCLREELGAVKCRNNKTSVEFYT